MPLTLLAGPANSGKVATLLDRYLDSLDEDPVLIVPNRPDVDRIERDLLERSPALLGGSIGTFADLFEQLARSDARRAPGRERGSARSGRPARARPRAAEWARTLGALPGVLRVARQHAG